MDLTVRVAVGSQEEGCRLVCSDDPMGLELWYGVVCQVSKMFVFRLVVFVIELV